MYHTTYIDNCIVLRHADNHTKHVQYHVIPTTALDIEYRDIQTTTPENYKTMSH